MKIRIGRDEIYPAYFAEEHRDGFMDFEITNKEFQEWQMVDKKWNEFQDKFHSMFENKKKDLNNENHT